MNHSMPGLPVHHQLPEFTQTHAHWVGDAIQASHPLSSPSPPAPNPSQHQGLFQWVNSSHEVAKGNYNEISPHAGQNGHLKKSINNKCLRGCGEKWTLLHCWWECKLIQALWKTLWKFLKKLGIKPPYDSANPLLGIYPEETKMKQTPVSHYSLQPLFTIARTWEQPRCPLADEWIKKLW